MKTNILRIKVAWLPIVILAIFVLAGCSPGPAVPATGQTPAGQTPAAGDETATEAVGGTPEIPQTGGNLVEVQLEEFQINMPASLDAGPASFEVTNGGTEEHSFVIEGQGIVSELERHLQPGETLTLDVDLAPGSYLVYCPVEDHADQGMQLDLTVNAP